MNRVIFSEEDHSTKKGKVCRGRVQKPPLDGLEF